MKLKQGLKLLVLEDDSMMRESLLTTLHEEGVQADGFSNYKQLEIALALQNYDVLLLDHYLPWKTGSEITNSIIQSARLKKTHIILMSGNKHVAEIANELNVDFLEKPFNVEDLLRILYTS